MKRRKPIAFIFILVLSAGFCFFIYYLYNMYETKIADLKEKCTPVSTKGEKKELDINSTFVLSLYNKVKTTAEEDVASLNKLDSSMKLYLAYKQIPESSFYYSSCNNFAVAVMPNYDCEETTTFTPRTFMEADLHIELLQLFGEDAGVENGNIQLGNFCLGGFQYIESRGEYVEGECQYINALTYKADKKLVKATSQGANIFLEEDVTYHGSDKTKIPDYLKNGTYVYTFKLDKNYNYIYLNKEYKDG